MVVHRLSTGAARVAVIEQMIRESGTIPTGPCRIDDLRYGSHTTEAAHFCDAHRYPSGSGYWTGRCPNGRIADWIARKHEAASMSERIEDTLAAFGFGGDEANTTLGMAVALAAPDRSLFLAIDLARYVMVPLPDAFTALYTPRTLRRLGLPIPKTSSRDETWEIVARETVGQAEAYATTFAGKAAIRAAKASVR